MPGVKPVLIYGRYHTTSAIFTHALKNLLDSRPELADRFLFHFLLDDRRDRQALQPILPVEKVSVRCQYEEMEPYPAQSPWTDTAVDRWEKLYGNPHLRSYIIMERSLEGRREEVKWRFLFSHIDYFERLVREIRPALYITGAADGLSPWVAMTVMKANGIPVLSFSPARFGKHSFILNNPFEVLHIGETYSRMRAGGFTAEERTSSQELLDEYRHRHLKPLDHLAVRAKYKRRSLLPNPVSAVNLFKESLTTDSGKFDLPLPAAVKRAFVSRRTGFYRWRLSRRQCGRLPEGEKFFFFPLQYEPEISLATQGKGWIRQMDLVKTISAALPVDRWLYVKEHPSMLLGIRPWRFYEELLALPKVRFLSQSLDSYQVVPKAEAVLTITGTAGWEALMHGRPVFLFGHSFYEEFEEGVVRVDDPNDLAPLLREARNRSVPDEAVLAYISAVFTRTKPGLFIEPRVYSHLSSEILGDQNLKDIGRTMLEYLK